MSQLTKIAISTLVILNLFSCVSGSFSAEQILSTQKIIERINNLGKDIDEIKKSEEDAARFRVTEFLIEYEYPIRDDELLIVNYRFKNDVCFEVNLSVFLNKQTDARFIMDMAINEIEKDINFYLRDKEECYYLWTDLLDSRVIELDFQHVERGSIMLSSYIVS